MRFLLLPLTLHPNNIRGPLIRLPIQFLRTSSQSCFEILALIVSHMDLLIHLPASSLVYLKLPLYSASRENCLWRKSDHVIYLPKICHPESSTCPPRSPLLSHFPSLLSYTESILMTPPSHKTETCVLHTSLFLASVSLLMPFSAWHTFSPCPSPPSVSSAWLVSTHSSEK